MVVRVRGACITVRNNKTGKVKVINRDDCKLVDPEIEWEEFEKRPTRQRNLIQHENPPGRPYVLQNVEYNAEGFYTNLPGQFAGASYDTQHTPSCT